MNRNQVAEFGLGIEIVLDPETCGLILVERITPNQGRCIRTGRVIPIPLKTASPSLERVCCFLC
jgi:hypothetical protein